MNKSTDTTPTPPSTAADGDRDRSRLESLAKQAHEAIVADMPDRDGRRSLRVLMQSAQAAGCKILVDGNEIPLANEANVSELVLKHPDFRQYRVWYDSFLGRIRHQSGEADSAGGANGDSEWTDHDSVNLQIALQQSGFMKRAQIGAIERGVIKAATSFTRDPPQEWANRCARAWDRTERLETFFSDAFGIENTDYLMDVSRAFWMGIASRIMDPGCQQDYMVVLESAKQGRLKSSFCEQVVLPEWYAAITRSIDDPKFIEEIQGKLVIEVPELEAFKRARGRHAIRSAISVRCDRARFAYERYARDYQRRCVFIATTNETEHMEEDERRELPVNVNKGDFGNAVTHVRTMREQYLGEAVTRLRAKPVVPWWNIRNAEGERESRIRSDTWTDVIRDMDCLRLCDRVFDAGRDGYEVSSMHILSEVFDIPVGKQTKSDQMRLSRSMEAAGWERAMAKQDGKRARGWRKFFE